MLVAVGQAIVIITRNVDLSVGSILGLTAYLTGRLFIDVPGIPLIVRVPRGLAFGAFLGLINGALVAFAKVPALVITLGTLYIYRGINVAWAGGDRINASDLPVDFRGTRHRPDRSASRSSRSSPPSCSWSRPGTCATSAAVASSTRSGPTPPPRTSTACG